MKNGSHNYTNNSLISCDYKCDYTILEICIFGFVLGIGGRVDLNIGYKRY